ncbi:MAG: hypothetical protein ACXVHB_29110 [Solirubrobacteraceae bacterium]
MVRQHRTAAAVAITLALTAGLAPTASADPAPLTRAEAAIAATHGSALVRPNADQQTATAATTYPGPCSEICSGGAGSYGSTSQLARTPDKSGATLPHGNVNPAPTVVRVVTHPGGFDWGDAGIGAAAALVLIGIGLTATRAATNTRRRHTREQRAIVTN